MKLIDKIICEKNIAIAISNLKKNKGSKTPGIDGNTILDIIENKEQIIQKIKVELSMGLYKPSLIKRIEIPKENGKTRPLGIPTIYDRVVQQSIKQILEPILDKKFHANSFGFRPNRSAENAIALNNNLINRGNLYFVVDIDIKSFFDNINHNKLIKQLYKIGIKEAKILKLIKVMLKSNVLLPDGSIIKSIKGTPQGGVLSPLLANVVLNELDWWIHRQWSGKKTQHDYGAQNHKERALKKTKLIEVKLVRYADDFKLFCRSRKNAEIMFSLTKNFLKKRLKLEVSREKSKVINLKKKSSEFLGFRIKAVRNKKKRTARTWILEKRKHKILQKLKEQIKIIQKYKSKAQAIKYNAMILGIQNYYNIATMVNIDLGRIGYILTRILKNRLGKGNYKKDILYERRYSKYNYKVWNVNKITLFTLDACKFKVPKQYSPKKKTRIEIDRLYRYTELGDKNWEVLRAKVRYMYNSKCAVTNEYINGNNNFHIHHIIPQKNGGKDTLENLILLKPEVHRALHSKNAIEYYEGNQTYKMLLESLSKYI